MCFWDKVSEVPSDRILKEIAVLECENWKSFQARSLRARSHNLFIDFLNVSVLSDTVVYSAIPYEKIKAYMFLRRSLASLARAYKLHVYIIYIFYVGTFGGLPPPPPYQKAGYATVASFRSPEEWPNEDGRFRPPPPPPTRYTKSPPLFMAPAQSKPETQVSLRLDLPGSLTSTIWGAAFLTFRTSDTMASPFCSWAEYTL